VLDVNVSPTSRLQVGVPTSLDLKHTTLRILCACRPDARSWLGRGVSQLQSQFNLKSRRGKPKGFAAIRAALAPSGASQAQEGMMWLICCLLPIPPVSKKKQRTA
jgi:hypothetical protein